MKRTLFTCLLCTLCLAGGIRAAGEMPPHTAAGTKPPAINRTPLTEPETAAAHESFPLPQSQESASARLPNPGIMVTAGQTQASESIPGFGPAKTPRLLTGTLAREINTSGPGYPIHLKSPEGRLIAFVDLAGIYITDLSPYLEQKVYLRGQIHPLPRSNGRLVILAEEIRLAK